VGKFVKDKESRFDDRKILDAIFKKIKGKNGTIESDRIKKKTKVLRLFFTTLPSSKGMPTKFLVLVRKKL